MLVQALPIVVQLAGDTGEVEVEHQVTVTARRRVLPNIQVAKKRVEPILGAYVIIMLQQVKR